MADFNIALKRTLILEGAFSNHPEDTGGRTLWGISEKWWPEAWEHGNPTRAKAEFIYRDHFWLPLRCNLIDSQNIANELFDTGVNCGIGKAAEFLQQAYNALYFSTGPLVEDGRIGPATLGKTNSLLSLNDQRALFNYMNHLQAEHYASLDNSDTFRRGWFAHRIGGWVDYE